MTALGRIVRSLAALAALVALLIGVPWGLWHFIGWPLPHSLPTWEQVSQALDSNGIPDELLFNSLAVVCWAAWAALAISIAVEVPAAVAGVAARRVPLTGPMQVLARHLVAAVLLLLPPISSRPAFAAPSSPVAWAAPARSVAVSVSPAHDLGTSAGHAIGTMTRSALRSSATTSAPTGEQELLRHRVAPKETLWGLAERYLGDPLRWREIFDLNLGHPQPDGDRLVNEDLLRPGWILLLPDAHVAAPPPEAPADGVGSDGGAQPSTTRPSQQEPATPQPAQPPTTSAPLFHDPDHERPATTRSQEHQGRRSPSPIVQLPLGGVVGLSLALAISAALAAARLHRRRRWQPADPAPGLTHYDPLVTDTVDRLVRAARAATGPGDDSADDDDELQPDVAADRPASPQTTPAAFGVITVGHRDGEELTLNIPATGGLALNGPGAVAAARAIIVTGLARNPEAEVEVVVAGADLAHTLLPGVATIDGLDVVADLDAALRWVEVEALYRARLLDDADTSTIDQFRREHPSEPLPLLLLVAANPPAVLGGRLTALLDSGQRFGVGAVIIGDAAGVGALEVDTDGAVTAAPDGPGPLRELRDARMMMLHPDQGREALAMVAASHGEPPVPLTVDVAETEAPAPSAFDRSAMLTLVSDAPRPVRVRLLGPMRIEVSGVEVRKGLRGAAREFFALLLIHPEGVDVEVAAEALWPDAPPPRGVERLRTALGNLRTTLRNATGIEKAVVVSYAAGRYQVQLDLVDADLWRFQTALAAAADAGEPAARTAALQQVVEAYDGDLAEGERYGWAEPLREDLRRRALDAAAKLADLHERDGDTQAALAVVEQAVTWDPYAEELYRRLMRLNAAIGRTDELRRVFDRLTTHLDELDADPDETTHRLFNELTGTTKRRRR
jgi:DNA-binding SARP family transcriptional activator